MTSPVRASECLTESLVRTYTVAAGQIVTRGYRVKFAAVDTEIQDCGAAENGFGIALASAIAGANVQILLEGSAVVKVKVGTGDATRGANAVMAADGWTSKTIGGGTVVAHVGGKFLESGVAGDLVGLMTGCPGSSVSA